MNLPPLLPPPHHYPSRVASPKEFPCQALLPRRLPSPLERRHPLRRRKAALRGTHRLPRPTHRRRREPLEIRRHASRRRKGHSTRHTGHRGTIAGGRTRRRERWERRHAAPGRRGDEAWWRTAGTAGAGHERRWGHSCCGEGKGGWLVYIYINFFFWQTL